MESNDKKPAPSRCGSVSLSACRSKKKPCHIRAHPPSCKIRKSTAIASSDSPKDLVCEWKSCGSGFHATSDLGSHVENHIKAQAPLNSYGFRCEWNGCKVNRKSFRDSWHLIVHVRYEHTGQQWTCPCCGDKQQPDCQPTISLHVLNDKDAPIGEPIFQTAGGDAQIRVHSDAELTADVEMPTLVPSDASSSPRTRVSDSPAPHKPTASSHQPCCAADAVSCCSAGPSSPQSCPETSHGDNSVEDCSGDEECWSCCSEPECKEDHEPAACADAQCKEVCSEHTKAKCSDASCDAGSCAQCCCPSAPCSATHSPSSPPAPCSENPKKRPLSAVSQKSALPPPPSLPFLSASASCVPPPAQASSSKSTLSSSVSSFNVRIYPKPTTPSSSESASVPSLSSSASAVPSASSAAAGKCEWRDCGSGFEKTDGLGEHIFDLHIQSQKARNRSQKTHGFVCEWKNCSRQKPFNSSYQLQHHIRFLHTGERPFSCTNCGSAFAQVYDLRHHQQKIHPALTTSSNTATSTTPTDTTSTSITPPVSLFTATTTELSSQTVRPDSLLAIPPPSLPTELFSIASPSASSASVAPVANGGSSSASAPLSSVTPLHILAQSAAIISKSEQHQQLPH